MKHRPRLSIPPATDAAEIDSLLGRGRFVEASTLAERAVAREPRNARAWLSLARAALGSGRLARATAACRSGLALAPSDPHLRLAEATVVHRLGRGPEAIESLERLLATRPPNVADVRVALAEALLRSGRHERLATLLSEADANAADERAAIHATRLLARTDRLAAIERFRGLFAEAKASAVRRVAGFEAVRLLDAAGRFREAFETAVAVHAATTPPFDVGAIEAELNAIATLAARGSPWFTPKASAADGFAFVVGLPRSGTTLLEQMLDRHPAISGIGEHEGVGTIHDGLVSLGLEAANLARLPAADAARLAAEYRDGALARRRPGAAWTFDKSLQTWRFLPDLAATLPGAAFVRLTRDARDSAISMFLSNFHPQAWGFTRDLGSIRRVIELERATVDPTIATLGLRAVRLGYEDLVAAPEREVRRVLDLLGLPFDPAVLAPEANSRAVLTLSHEQVRAPINRTGIGRWKNYAFAFDSSWERLG